MNQDLKNYSDQELSLIVFNDEYFYKMKRLILKDPTILDDFYEYTPEQLEVLIQDIKDDLED